MTELLEILDTHRVTYKKTNNPTEVLIKCTSGNHDDSNPSLSYNLEDNIFHCWSCGFSGGKNKFLNIVMTKSFQFGLDKIADAFQKRAEDLFGNSKN